MLYIQAINRLKTEIQIDRKEIKYAKIMINKLNENSALMLNSIKTKKETIKQLRKQQPEDVTWSKLKKGHKLMNTKTKLLFYIERWCK